LIQFFGTQTKLDGSLSLRVPIDFPATTPIGTPLARLENLRPPFTGTVRRGLMPLQAPARLATSSNVIVIEMAEPDTTATVAQAESSSSGSNVTEVALIVLLVLACICGLCCLFFGLFWWRRRKQRSAKSVRGTHTHRATTMTMRD
jgi:hypothetical protein